MKALVFDFDGTILDTEKILFSAWQYVYSEYNCNLPLHLWQKRVGSDSINFDPMQYLQDNVDYKLDPQEITLNRRKKLNELIPDLVPLSGVSEWLNMAHKLNMKLAIASGSPREWIIGHLQRTDLLKYFDEIISIEEVTFAKPHPEIYNLALNKLKIHYSEAIAIEDSPSGVSAALATKLECVVVSNEMTENLAFPKTFCRLDSLKQSSLLEVLKMLK